jgi:uncharacterized membrane protein
MSESAGPREQVYRSVCAILGLILGMVCMVALGLQSLVGGAIFGAAGAVLGGMTGERLARRRDA